ncbi:hypothetical protein PPBDW_I21319 [Photobacterium kishitanii]|nr:hypothetical protein PPBDW_I21319 [Photobacterium kishitanii]
MYASKWAFFMMDYGVVGNCLFSTLQWPDFVIELTKNFVVYLYSTHA